MPAANVFSAIPLPLLYGIVSTLGTGGLVMILWYLDSRRFSSMFMRQQEAQHEHQESVDKILNQYKDDVNKVTGYYERNVELVESYAKLAGELAQIIHLNTQVQTRLVDSINHNMFCPIVREAGPQRER